MQLSYSSGDYQGYPRPRPPYYLSYAGYYPGYPIYPYRFEEEQCDEDL